RERRSPGHEINVAAKASYGVAMPQPRRVDAHGRDMAGFAKLDVRYRLRQLRDVIFDVSVELLSDGSNSIASAAERNALVQRQDFLKHSRGLPVRQMACPLCLEVFQLRCGAVRQSFRQGMDHTPRRPRGPLASTRPQPRAEHGHLAVYSTHH